MDWAPGVPSRVSATRRPLVRPTVREAARPRGEFRLEAHQGRPAALVHDPSGDLAPGLPLSLQEIAYGLKLGVWRPGTAFRLAGRLLYARADGWVHNEAGDRVLLVRSIGR